MQDHSHTSNDIKFKTQEGCSSSTDFKLSPPPLLFSNHMEKEESKPEVPFLPWLWSHFNKRVGKDRNPAVSIFHNRPIKRVLFGKFRPPLRAFEGKKKKKKKKVAWVSLQGLLVDAEEATSSEAIKGKLRLEEAAAWELFTPLQRVIIVAVVSVAALNQHSQITKLRRHLEMKDQMLLALREKLKYSLKQEEAYTKDQELHFHQNNKHEADFVQKELESMKHKIFSLQKEIETLKDKAPYQQVVTTSGVGSSSASEANRELHKKQVLAEAELYKQEEQAATKRAAADTALYVAKQTADAELYKMRKEAEGIKAIADALTKPIGDNGTSYMGFKDYMMIRKGSMFPQLGTSNPENIHDLHPNLSSSNDDAGENNHATKNTSKTLNALRPLIEEPTMQSAKEGSPAAEL